MYNPIVGRWMEEDPIGFRAGDANKYRDVGNDPTNASDPTGLAPGSGWELVKGTPVPLEDNSFPFGTGTGTVKVFKDATVKNMQGRTFDKTIWIQFTASGGQREDLGDPYLDRLAFKGVPLSVNSAGLRYRAPATQNIDSWVRENWFQGVAETESPGYVGENTHWLQFIARYWVGTETKKPLDPFVYDTIKSGQGHLWYSANEKGRHVDTESLTDPFYDSSGGAHKRTDSELAILDGPKIDQEDRFLKVGAVFDTFLVCGGQVYYHLHWERIGTRTGNKWDIQYTNIKGKVVTDGKLPSGFVGANNTLLIGHKKADDEGKLTGKVEVPNPVK